MKTKTHIMVDLETMDTKPTAAIVSIGAVRFNEKEIIDKFEAVIDVQSCIDLGLSISGSTLYWWLEQSTFARRSLLEPKVSLAVGLSQFSSFLANQQFETVWGNGCNFDNVILANAYNTCQLKMPWPFWKDRCFRTIKANMPNFELPQKSKLVTHKALDDAIQQTEYLLAVYKHGYLKTFN